ncbi:hypothetical protein [Millisia brevis]|uniref:hypothetical protein n=1 Tax=Millisia brevis TaxID=264148 RepID=UPI00082C9099|nr:hypothetical protein [Millisia brevis]
MNRTVSVVRLHLVNIREVAGVPWMVTAGAFAIILMIAGAMRWAGIDDTPYNGAISSLMVSTGVVLAMAATQRFALAIGLGFGRSVYLAGTALLAVGISVAFGAIVWLLSLIERATDGWWLGAPFFRPAILPDSEAATLLCMVAVMLLSTTLGLFLGALYRRWRAPGLYVLSLTVLLLSGLSVAVITRWEAWSAVGQWFAETPRLVLLGAVPAGCALLAMLASVAVLRHAEP